MEIVNGSFPQYAVNKIEQAVLDNYRITGERRTIIKLGSAEERETFRQECKKLDSNFKVTQEATLVFTVYFLG